MANKPIDSVQLNGWSSETAARAVASLSDLVSTCPDDLAVELVRWLRCAAETDLEDLAKHLQALRPWRAHLPRWLKDRKLRVTLGHVPLVRLVAHA